MRIILVRRSLETSVPRMRRAAYRFIQVRPERFFGTEKVWIGECPGSYHRP